MPLTFHKDKKQPLTAAEVDGNFQDIDERLKALEQAPKAALLASITLEGNRLIFEGTDGIKFPPLDVPIIVWRSKGIWAPNQSYMPYDVVQYGSSIYVCHHAHTSSSSDIEAYWKTHGDWTCIFTLPPLSPIDVHHEPQKGELALDKNGVPTYYTGEKWVSLKGK